MNEAAVAAVDNNSIQRLEMRGTLRAFIVIWLLSSSIGFLQPKYRIRNLFRAKWKKLRASVIQQVSSPVLLEYDLSEIDKLKHSRTATSQHVFIGSSVPLLPSENATVTLSNKIKYFADNSNNDNKFIKELFDRETLNIDNVLRVMDVCVARNINVRTILSNSTIHYVYTNITNSNFVDRPDIAFKTLRSLKVLCFSGDHSGINVFMNAIFKGLVSCKDNDSSSSSSSSRIIDNVGITTTNVPTDYVALLNTYNAVAIINSLTYIKQQRNKPSYYSGMHKLLHYCIDSMARSNESIRAESVATLFVKAVPLMVHSNIRSYLLHTIADKIEDSTGRYSASKVSAIIGGLCHASITLPEVQAVFTAVTRRISAQEKECSTSTQKVECQLIARTCIDFMKMMPVLSQRRVWPLVQPVQYIANITVSVLNYLTQQLVEHSGPLLSIGKLINVIKACGAPYLKPYPPRVSAHISQLLSVLAMKYNSSENILRIDIMNGDAMAECLLAMYRINYDSTATSLWLSLRTILPRIRCCSAVSTSTLIDFLSALHNSRESNSSNSRISAAEHLNTDTADHSGIDIKNYVPTDLSELFYTAFAKLINSGVSDGSMRLTTTDQLTDIVRDMTGITHKILTPGRNRFLMSVRRLISASSSSVHMTDVPLLSREQFMVLIHSIRNTRLVRRRQHNRIIDHEDSTMHANNLLQYVSSLLPYITKYITATVYEDYSIVSHNDMESLLLAIQSVTMAAATIVSSTNAAVAVDVSNINTDGFVQHHYNDQHCLSIRDSFIRVVLPLIEQSTNTSTLSPKQFSILMRCFSALSTDSDSSSTSTASNSSSAALLHAMLPMTERTVDDHEVHSLRLKRLNNEMNASSSNKHIITTATNNADKHRKDWHPKRSRGNQQSAAATTLTTTNRSREYFHSFEEVVTAMEGFKHMSSDDPSVMKLVTLFERLARSQLNNMSPVSETPAAVAAAVNAKQKSSVMSRSVHSPPHSSTAKVWQRHMYTNTIHEEEEDDYAINLNTTTTASPSSLIVHALSYLQNMSPAIPAVRSILASLTLRLYKCSSDDNLSADALATALQVFNRHRRNTVHSYSNQLIWDIYPPRRSSPEVVVPTLQVVEEQLLTVLSTKVKDCFVGSTTNSTLDEEVTVRIFESISALDQSNSAVLRLYSVLSAELFKSIPVSNTSASAANSTNRPLDELVAKLRCRTVSASQNCLNTSTTSVNSTTSRSSNGAKEETSSHVIANKFRVTGF